MPVARYSKTEQEAIVFYLKAANNEWCLEEKLFIRYRSKSQFVMAKISSNLEIVCFVSYVLNFWCTSFKKYKKQ